MQGPLVSVVVPCYNGERYLAEALASIFAQDYRPMEVLVVDDGSTDRSLEVAQAWPVRCLQQPNQGAAAARNAGVAASSGSILAFLDADDLWGPDKLSLQVHHLLEHPEVDLCYGYLQSFLEAGIEWPDWFLVEFRDQLEPAMGAPTVVVRRAAWDRVGPFDTTLRLYEDTDWHNRAQEVGLVMVQLPSVVVRRRLHGNNSSHHLNETGRGYWCLRLAHRKAQRRRQRS